LSVLWVACFVILWVRYSLTCLRFFLPWLRFFSALSSVARQIPEQNSQRRGTARTLPHQLLFVLFGCYFCCSMYCLCLNVYCHRVTTQLQLTNIAYYISYKVFFKTQNNDSVTDQQRSFASFTLTRTIDDRFHEHCCKRINACRHGYEGYLTFRTD
jgi:hypothetical protein